MNYQGLLTLVTWPWQWILKLCLRFFLSFETNSIALNCLVTVGRIWQMRQRQAASLNFFLPQFIFKTKQTLGHLAFGDQSMEISGFWCWWANNGRFSTEFGGEWYPWSCSSLGWLVGVTYPNGYSHRMGWPSAGIWLLHIRPLAWVFLVCLCPFLPPGFYSCASSWSDG